MKDYTSGAFEGYDPEDVKGLVKDRHDATVSYFEEVYDAVEELCEGVEEPRGEIQYIHYFCGVSGQSEESDEIYARLREKLYRLVSSLVRAFAEAKPYLVDDISSGKLNEYDKKVTFYIELKKTIGTASGDFLDLKAYEPDMRKMIDNYITAADAEKIGDFDDLTLLDFVAKQGETLTGEGDSGHKVQQRPSRITSVRRLSKRSPSIRATMQRCQKSLINSLKSVSREFLTTLRCLKNILSWPRMLIARRITINIRKASVRAKRSWPFMTTPARTRNLLFAFTRP